MFNWEIFWGILGVFVFIGFFLSWAFAIIYYLGEEKNLKGISLAVGLLITIAAIFGFIA
jgi:hypothetical protein